jgi:hypothetical protein
MALNIITDNTGYVTFDFYDQKTGLKSHTVDIVKINVTSIQSYIYEKIEDITGVVTITTISQDSQYYKSNGLIQLSPSQWALSGTPTVPIADVATLRSNLLTYFSSKW